MNGTIQSEADLQRANIRLAWAFSDQMTHAQFLQLIDVTIDQLRQDAGLANGQSPVASREWSLAR